MENQPDSFFGEKEIQYLIDEFLKWYESTEHQHRDNPKEYQNMSKEFFDSMSDNEFVDFFYDFAYNGGHIQHGGPRTAGRFKETIENNILVFRKHINRIFDVGFSLDDWWEESSKFNHFGKGIRSIFLHRCFPDIYPVYNNKSVEAFQILGLLPKRFPSNKNPVITLKVAIDRFIQFRPDQLDLNKADYFTHFLIGTNEGKEIYEKVNERNNLPLDLAQNIAHNITAIARNYPAAELGKDSMDPIKDVFNDIVNTLKDIFNSKKYKIDFGVGFGIKAKIPWFGFTDLRVSDKFTQGIYCCCLFHQDMKKIFITLNQGVKNDNKDTLIKRKKDIRKKYAECFEKYSLSVDDNIDLGGKTASAINYQNSTIAYKGYHISNLNKNEFISDLLSLSHCYDKIIKDLIGVEEGMENYKELVSNESLMQVSEGTESYSDTDQRNYYWLNANPKVWDLNSLKIGERHKYSLYNEEGNKSRHAEYFEELTPGDLLIGYITSPKKKVFSILRVTRGLHDTEDGEKFEFEKIDNLVDPISYDKLKSIPELANCEPVINNQGSLFKITYEEFQIITGAKMSEMKALEPYGIEDALNELFVDKKEFKDILNTLEIKKNIILQGPPGVGKTFIAKRLAFSLVEEKNDANVEMIQFHQSYAYEDFIQGYRPTDDGKFLLKNGLFYDFCMKAKRNPEEKFFFIIDEINRGNLSKIFGELMMLIESDKRSSDWAVSLTYSNSEDDKFYIPENVYLIGTMNTADRSLAMVDYALRRRFSFITLKPCFNEAFIKFLLGRGIERQVIDRIVNKLNKLNEEIAADKKNLGEGFKIGHSFFCNFNGDIDSRQWYERIIKTEIEPLIYEYWFDNEEYAKKKIEELQIR